jgi:SAM-dependent methyltransferase
MLTNYNLEEYADPILYDLENHAFEPAGPFYLALAQRFGGSVLEIGCGTGRFTIPLARFGIDMTGLDIAPQMLERARLKAPELSIEWVQADARTSHLDRQFRFIFESVATFQHLLERADQEAMLACVYEHLEPAGYFVVSLIFPHTEVMVNEATERKWFSYFNEQGQEVQVSGIQQYDPLRQIKTETAYRRWREANGQEVVRSAALRLRYIFPQEMEMLLSYNGFMILEGYGDMNFSPLTDESKHMSYVCRKTQ